tara:strand:+ start:819 stop:1871 length:1053 start_codon:yes stop_codon:yes gene_type:complete
MLIYQWKQEQLKNFSVNSHNIVEQFKGYGNDTSFKIEFDFIYGGASGGCVNFMITYDRLGHNKGWAICLEDYYFTFLVGNGKKNESNGWNKVRTSGHIPNHHWCHATCILDSENNKISVDVSYTAGEKKYPVGVGLVEEDMIYGSYVEYPSNKIIFSLNEQRLPIEKHFNPFIGSMKNFKIYPLTKKIDENEWLLFNDVPVDVIDISVSNLINLIDQYSNDRDYIKNAVERLRVELNEEIDLNNNLKKLSQNDAVFIVKKIKEFVETYKNEIIGYETELKTIYNQLSTLIIENANYMDDNKIIKDEIENSDMNNLGSSINNIKTLIDTNVNLLKDNKRWGDTGDKYWKFV